jgi:hypothetical protein
MNYHKILNTKALNKLRVVGDDLHRKDREKQSPDPKILIGKIEDDYRLISKDKTKKMSAITLKYLRDHRIIKANQYVLYRQISERAEERTMVIEKNVIEWVNSKLIYLYENA